MTNIHMRNLLLIFVNFFVLFIIFTEIFPKASYAQIEETLEAEVLNVVDQIENETPLGMETTQTLELKIVKGVFKGDVITIDHNAIPSFGSYGNIYQKGEKVLVMYTHSEDTGKIFTITDYSRYRSLYVLFAIFVLVSILGAGIWGIKSIVGLAYSFIIVFVYILPLIIKGYNPLLVTISGCFLIAPGTFTLSHGFNRKTYIALGATLVALLITGVLATISIGKIYLTGYASEEASFISIINSEIDIQLLLLAGIIIGSLGILDDATVSQSSIVSQLKNANSELKGLELYKRAMQVGKDHIASAVNTLVLVYVGAALPLMTLFLIDPSPYWEVLNYEIVAEEITRMLVSSIGLISAIPITTALAVKFASGNDSGHTHNH